MAKQRDTLEVMSRFRPAKWRSRAPRSSDGFPDRAHPLGKASLVWDEILDLDRAFGEKLGKARRTFTKDGLREHLPRLTNETRQALHALGEDVAAIESRHAKMLRDMTPKAAKIDPVILEMRAREVRELLAGNKPNEAEIAITSDAEDARWIIRRYQEAAEDGDVVVMAALEGVTTAHPAWMQLSPSELADLRLRRAEAEHPDIAGYAKDIRDALSDLAHAAAQVDTAITAAEREIPPEPEKRDTSIRVYGGGRDAKIDAGGETAP